MSNFSWQIEHFPTPRDLEAHLANYAPPTWAEGFTIHHTVKPLPQDWRGRISMENIGRYYEKTQKWPSGPHLFFAPDGIWQGCPMDTIGVHAGICNSHRFGGEVVGFYDRDVWQEPIRSFVLDGVAVVLRWINQDAKAVNGHRDCKSPKTCPGRAIDMDWARAEIQARLGGELLPVSRFEDNSADSSVCFRARGTVDQAINWFAPRSSYYTLGDIITAVNWYAQYGEAAEIDWFTALAQVAHETANLNSWWCQRPRRNPAGIGVDGHTVAGSPDHAPGVDWAWDGKVWRAGESFASWELSCKAHLGRLLAYALPAGAGTPVQQGLISFALNVRPLPDHYRGIAPTWRGLNTRWASPGKTYAQQIAKIANQMRQQ